MTLTTIARLLISPLFIVSAISKIKDPDDTKDFMKSKKMPWVDFLYIIAIFLELGGGLLVLTGFYAAVGAILLLLFLVPTTFIFHNFWIYKGQDRTIHMTNFLKNLSMIGGLLLVIGFS